MYFSITTDEIGVVNKLISDLVQNSDAMRVAVRRVGKDWKAIGCELPPKDADLLIPVDPTGT